MIIWLCIRWWYGPGLIWIWRHSMVEPLSRCAESFSLKEMARTLFAPYKQTYSGGSDGSIQNFFRSAVDSFISRIVGFLVRIILIIAGVASSLVIAAGGLIVTIAWPLLPILLVLSIFIQIVSVL